MVAIRKYIVLFSAIFMLFSPLLSVGVVYAAAPTITRYPWPDNTVGVDVTVGPDGALWSQNSMRINRMALDGQSVNFPIPSPYGGVYGITAGPDGAIWFTEANKAKIGRLTLSGSFTEYPVTINAYPFEITSGPDGALWFTETGGNGIGRITTAGVYSRFNTPTNQSEPYGITVGPDNALWFTEVIAGKIGRITTDGSITEYPIPTSGSYPVNITAGPDGALWFTETKGSKIGRITTDGNITEYSLPSPYNNYYSSQPWDITAGPDGALWFTLYGVSSIGRITTDGSINLYYAGVNQPRSIVMGPDNALWFTSNEDNALSRVAVQVPPKSPTNLMANSPTQQAQLSWSLAVGANSYDVYRDGAKIGSTVSTNYTDNNAADGTHTYAVVAVAADGSVSPQSNTVTVLIDKTVPTITSNIDPEANSADWINADATVSFTCDDALSGIASCSNPVTVSTEGISQSVTGTAIDNAGNSATTATTLNIDKTVPSLSTQFSQAPNDNGWNNSPITVSYACSDELSGIKSCSSPINQSADGIYDLVGYSSDNADNIASTNSTLRIDQTAPAVSNVNFATNPLITGLATTLNATLTDNLSGIARAEYYIGSDPGAGGGTAMSMSGNTAIAAIGPYANPGMYTYFVRTQDIAGNWSASIPVTLDVYNPSAGYAAGHGFIVPGGLTSDSGDNLPTVSGKNVKATLDFSVKYSDAQSIVPVGDSTFSWGSGNCKKADNTCFVVETDSLNWLIVPGNNTATFQGFASVSLNGQSLGSGYIVRVSLDTSNTTSDHYLLQVYQSGANPDVDTAAYQASGDLVAGSIKLHP
jgi:virginiamycin B lyase